MVEGENRGKILTSWAFPEVVKHERSQGWFIGMGILAGFLVVYGVWTKDFLFALIIVMGAAITLLHHYKEALPVSCTLYELGLEIGHKYWEYRDLKTFWIIYEPPQVKTLYLQWRLPKPIIGIPLHNQNPLKIREMLNKYLTEDLDKEREPLTDGLVRMLKL